MKNIHTPSIFFLLFLLVSCSQKEQEIVTLEDYKRAEKFLSVNTTPLVYGIISNITWINENEFLYTTSVDGGEKFMLGNVLEKSKEPAFDHEKMATAISEITGSKQTPHDLQLRNLTYLDQQLSFSLQGQQYSVNLNDYSITKIQSKIQRNEFLSPDGKKAAYIKDFNLWIRNTETNARKQLTFDGEKDYGYATNNAGWTKSDGPVLKWSPDSKMIATFQHDGRGVGEMYLWSTKVGHPDLEAWKYPLPGDSLIFRIARVVIHTDPVKVVRLQVPPDPHRSTISDHIAGRGGDFLDVEWSQDGSQLAFVSSSRDHKIAHLQVADPLTGSVQSILKEEVDTYFESGNNMVNWHVLKNSNEVIWFSERDNWGHLYLYDLTTGKLNHQITKGEWSVLQVHHIDEVNRTIYFLGSNKEEGDPYFRYLYRIDFDGNNLLNLTPENADHSLSWSDTKKYFIDTYSTRTTPPISVVRNLKGDVEMPLEESDITALLATGWVAPIPFTVKARDEKTDLYGMMYKPSNFDDSKKYPILNYLYPGPQSGSVGSRSFSPSRADKQSLAELGFIVVEVDALGSPGRSKSFHDGYYGNMGDNGLPDQIGMIKQLAAQHSWMDLDRVGIWGHSGGGFASTDAILRYPEFYKVAVSGAGNHDNRNYEDDWGEKWQGLLVNYPNSSAEGSDQKINLEIQEGEEKTNYDNQANQLLANNLKGKLLIAHGMLDGNVHPSNTLLVVDALIAADKDFDMLVFPNARHGFGNSRYFMKRRWDYFVTHLKGVTPPVDFVFGENIK